MNNERTKPVEDQQRTDSRLAEYQVCQQSVNIHGSSYWSMTGIFIAFSSVLLSAIIFGLISNEALFDELSHVKFFEASKQVVVFRVLVTIIGLIILGIYFTLWRWLQRVRYLQQANYRRMREIEIKSGMHIGLLITGIDDWNKLTAEEQQYLTALEKGEERCKEQKGDKLYASPTSRWNHKVIFALLALLWVIMIPSVWLLYLRYYKYILIVLIVLYVAFIYRPEIKGWFQRTKQKTNKTK
ncbi:hypothetical protein ACFLX8_00010 [Chloroflexota bacterium]